ncbi:hypothetical protein IHE45_08G076800 [Dioscorea alata]|uniref:Uncharacterized protein n=1 Tax=Dioscorea alata TaxID=55571 RepID=A0ACB7VK40_DIOAL|nr:hypothetical protein IHE45_08G076800 [Dioscorea alata]
MQKKKKKKKRKTGDGREADERYCPSKGSGIVFKISKTGKIRLFKLGCKISTSSDMSLAKSLREKPAPRKKSIFAKSLREKLALILSLLMSRLHRVLSFLTAAKAFSSERPKESMR